MGFNGTDLINIFTLHVMFHIVFILLLSHFSLHQYDWCRSVMRKLNVWPSLTYVWVYVLYKRYEGILDVQPWGQGIEGNWVSEGSNCGWVGMIAC